MPLDGITLRKRSFGRQRLAGRDMGFFKNIWDGLLSLLAAVASFAVFAVPIWATHQAISYGIVPIWAYAAVIGLVFIGGNLTIAFLRKALDGVAPLKDRKRR